eukprot:2554032-Rhodomonas_salina.1
MSLSECKRAWIGCYIHQRFGRCYAFAHYTIPPCQNDILKQWSSNVCCLRGPQQVGKRLFSAMEGYLRLPSGAAPPQLADPRG